MNGEQVGGIVRAILATLGGYLVSKGIGDAATVTAVAGGLASAIAAAWSWYTNRPGTVIAPSPK